VIALNEYELLTNSSQLLIPCNYLYIMDGTTLVSTLGHIAILVMK
jgi:hypothetical protein